MASLFSLDCENFAFANMQEATNQFKNLFLINWRTLQEFRHCLAIRQKFNDYSRSETVDHWTTLKKSLACQKQFKDFNFLGSGYYIENNGDKNFCFNVFDLVKDFDDSNSFESLAKFKREVFDLVKEVENAAPAENVFKYGLKVNGLKILDFEDLHEWFNGPEAENVENVKNCLKHLFKCCFLSLKFGYMPHRHYYRETKQILNLLLLCWKFWQYKPETQNVLTHDQIYTVNEIIELVKYLAENTHITQNHKLKKFVIPVNYLNLNFALDDFIDYIKENRGVCYGPSGPSGSNCSEWQNLRKQLKNLSYWTEKATEITDEQKQNIFKFMAVAPLKVYTVESVSNREFNEIKRIYNKNLNVLIDIKFLLM